MSPKPGGDAVAAAIYLALKTKRAGAVKGEATAAGHENHIVLHGFHFGVRSSSAIGSGQATARRQYDAVQVWKRLDSATTPLLSALTTNDEVSEAKLSLRKAAGGQEDFFVITLQQARVVATEIDCDETGNPVERVSFAFAKIEVSYRAQKGSGLAGATSSFQDDWQISA